jgi:hypothetical protein
MKGGTGFTKQVFLPCLDADTEKYLPSRLLSILIKPVWGSHMHQWMWEGLFFMPELAAHKATAKSQTFASRSQQIQLMV